MKLTYRPEIDGLRAIAVGAVILYHAQITIFGHQPFKGGFIGVDIFFVISGYLITSIILKELVTTGTFSFKHFYERRVRRILPALLFVMLSSLPFAWFYMSPNGLINFSKTTLYTLSFISNFYFHISSLEYFAGGAPNILLHTWSLSVEEQYYILFPIVLLVTFKYFRKYLIHILILGFFISLGLAEWTSRNYPSASFYFLHTRIWELLAGSILAYYEITKGYRSKNKTLNLILPFTGLILIGHSILFFNDGMFHPSFYTLSPIIGVCLIIWFSNKKEIITKILSTKLFVGIGLISYSLYLWHYPIFVFNILAKFTEGNLSKKVLLIIVIFVFSIITYYFIERPSRNKNTSLKIIISTLSLKFLTIILFCIYILNLNIHPFLTKYEHERKAFMSNYNYNSFDSRKNIFIIGNSYSVDLLNLFFQNKNLNKKFYFYTTVSDDIGAMFQVSCLLDFLENKTKICNKQIFTSFKKQYEKSDYIILAESLTESYISPQFEKSIKHFRNDKKKFIVFLDDLTGTSILDKFLYKKQKIPNSNELLNLEKKFFLNKTNSLRENLIKQSKDKFFKNDIKYLTRSRLYCDYLEKKCDLIKNNEKIHSDDGHITNNGAKYLSNRGGIIINKLVK